MAMKKNSLKSKKTWKNILVIGLSIITLLGVAVGIAALVNKSEEETTKKNNPTYAIGGLTETGTYLETKESIYTKDAFECYGLKTTLNFDNNISYKLFFYDEDKTFVESTSQLIDTFDSSKTLMPGGTKYCRVVITPNEDSKISWYEKNSYAKQLTIKVNKDQTKIAGVEKVLTNYFEVDETKNGYALSPSDFVAGSTMNYSEVSGNSVSKALDVSGYRHYQLRVIDNGTDSLVNYYFTDADNKFVSFNRFDNGTSAEYIIDIPAAATYFYINYKIGTSAIVNIITD